MHSWNVKLKKINRLLGDNLYVVLFCLNIKGDICPLIPSESPPMFDLIRTPRTSNLVQYGILPMTNNGMGACKKFSKKEEVDAPNRVGNVKGISLSSLL